MPGPPVDPLDVVLHVQVVPSGKRPRPAAAVRARAAVMPTRNGQPREIRWGPAGWPAPLAALTFTALDAGSAGRGSWRAVYLDPGEVDGARAAVMAGTLALLRTRMDLLARAEGQPADFAAYLGHAARALDAGGAVPFAIPSPVACAPPTWWRCNATALQAWLEAELRRHRSGPRQDPAPGGPAQPLR
jgi:hypothetical protein